MDNVLFLTLQFLSVLAFGMFWHRILKWSPEEGVGMAVVTALTALFVGGWFGAAQMVLVILYVFSAAGVFLQIFGRRLKIADTDSSVGDFFSPGIVLLMLIYVYAVAAFRELAISNWDEMHQWAKAVRFMVENNALPYGNNYDGADVLLSSTTIFHYYFCKLARTMTGVLTESNMYVSNMILWFSAAVLPLSGLKWKNWKSCLLYGMTVFLSMHLLFVQPYFNIYCDQAVAVWAGALIAWILFCDEKKFRGIFIVQAILHIALMKSMMGPLFSMVIVLALFIKYVMSFEANFKDTIAGIKKDLNIRKILFGASSLAAVFLLTVVWSMRISENALNRGGSVIRAENDRVALTLKSGLEKWFQPVNLATVFPNLTYFIFLILTVVLCVWFSKKYVSGSKRKLYQVLIGFYVFGFFAFFAVMMYSYLTTFSYEDSIITGSLHRYLSDYMILGLIPLIMPAFWEDASENGGENARTGKIKAGAVVLMLFFLAGTTNGFYSKVVGVNTKKSPTYKAIVKLQQKKESALALMDSEEKIYMINQTPDGTLTVAADYVFGSLLTRTSMCYYFTEEDEEIPGSSFANIRSLPDILLKNGYGYLWIYKTDEYFDSMAFSALKIQTPKAGDFYKVIDKDGRLKLQYLGNLNENDIEEE